MVTLSRSVSEPNRVGSVAVLGTGSIGMRHLKVLRGLEQGVPIAVPKRPERIVQLEDAGYRTARNLEEAVEKGASHCVIASETGSHVNDGLAAVDLGLDLLVEKPLATDRSQGILLDRRATERRRKLYVACVYRFSKSLDQFRGRLPVLGKIHAVRIECQSYLPDWQTGRPYLETFRARPVEGGVLLDLVHEIDYAGWLFGWPGSLQARVRNLGILGIHAAEDAELYWETSSGCAVSIKLDYLTKPPRRRATAFGEQGSMEWDGIVGTVTSSIDGQSVQIEQPGQDYNEMFSAQARAFLDALADRVDPRLADGADGVRALAVCDAAVQASNQRRETGVLYS